MKAYTYLIKHIPTGKVYYGYRSANKVEPADDLWKKYFTSSLRIKELIEETSKDDFAVEIRRTFETAKQASDWESKVLTRCKVLESDTWLNGNILGYIQPTPESCAKISAFHKGKPKSKEHRRKMSKAAKGKKHPWNCTSEYRAKMSEAKSGKKHHMYGKHHSNETRAKIGAANKIKMLEKGDNHHMKHVEWTQERRASMAARSKNRPADFKYPTKTCPHCGKECPTNVYKRWHGENCKSKKSTSLS